MDKEHLLQVLRLLADATQSAYGRNCEVAVHDLEDIEHSLVYIAGKVTGRKPGAPITDLAYTMIREHGDNAPDLLTYRTVTKTGRTLKCSTVFVRNDAGHIQACYCINQDITDFLSAKAALDEFTQNEERQMETRQETFAETVDEIVESLVLECATRMGKHPASMSREERVDLVRELTLKDVFKFRGAAETIASILGVSRYTVYNYLKEAKR
ncbi:MAG: PAS domain-containing protein [Desulfovibrionaceae bacterium]|jgi:predicted transcriptional regulator YheO|nr:PAS domain-containing protein [Desulfovibrionaceae bacterium]